MRPIMLTALLLLTTTLNLQSQCQRFTQPYGTVLTDTSRSYRIIPVRGGQFVLVGEWQRQLLLLKVNEFGTQIAIQRYGNTTGGAFSRLLDVVEMADGSLVAVGECKGCQQSSDNQTKVILLKINGNLTIDQNTQIKILGKIGSALDERASPRIIRKGNNLIVVSSISTGVNLNTQDLVISEWSPSLDLLWERQYNTGFFEAATGLSIVGNDVLVAIARAFVPQSVLLKIGPDGTELWRRFFNADAVRGLAFQPTQNRVAIAGDRTIATNNVQAFMMSFDASTGAARDSALIGDSGPDRAMSIAALSNGGWLVPVQANRSGVVGTASRVYRLDNNFAVRCSDWIPNPDAITSMNVTDALPVDASGNDFVATGIRGLVNRAFFHKQQDCHNRSINYTFCKGQSVEVFGQTMSTPGTITRTFKNQMGCDSVVTAIVKETEIVLAGSTITPVTPGADGRIDISITGGAERYCYFWVNGNTGSSITVSRPGTYTVTVTACAIGCTASFSLQVGSAATFDQRETFGLAGLQTGALQKIVRTADGQLIASGQLLGFPVLAKLDCGGKIILSANLSGILPDSATITDVLPLADGQFVVTGERRVTVGTARRSRIFAFKCNAQLVPDGSIGLKTYDIASGLNAVRPVVKRWNNSFVVAFHDDFFGGNLQLLTLDEQLNQRSIQQHNFSFIEHAAGLAVVGSSIFVVENAYIVGESNKISISKFEDINGDQRPDLIWERKHIGAVGSVLALSNGDLLATGWRRKMVSGTEQDVTLALRLRSTTGAVADSLITEQAGADLQIKDAQLLPNGNVLALATQINSFFDHPRATPVYTLSYQPNLRLLSTAYASGHDEPSHLFPASIAALGADGQHFALVGWRGNSTDLVRGHLFTRTDAACARTIAPLNAFNSCAPGTLVEPECPGGAYCQPKVLNDVQYGSAVNVQGVTVPLMMDIYIPRSIADNPGTTQRRPLMVLAHGGGFVFGDEDVYAERAVYFAQRGYIVASIAYRLGVPNMDNACNNPPEAFLQAAFRAMQDGRNAINFLITNANQYNIDTEQLYMHGFSAGAALSMAMAFMDESDVALIRPLIGNLGNLPPLVRPLKAVFPFGGVSAVGLDLFDPGERTPVYAAHGTCDATVPFAEGANICPNFPPSPGTTAAVQRLNQNGTPVQFHVYLGAGHGFEENRTEFELYRSMLMYLRDRVACGSPLPSGCVQTPYKPQLPCATAPSCRQLVDVKERMDEVIGALVLSPNPSPGGLLHLALPEGFIPDETRVDITDQTGRLVQTALAVSVDGTIHCNTLSPGVYFCYARFGQRIAVGRWVLTGQ